MPREMKVAIGGLGAIGGAVARDLLAGDVPGLRLVAVSARDAGKAATTLGSAGTEVPILPLGELAEVADIVVESLPSALFDDVAVPAVEAGRILMVLSAGALLERGALIDRARETGARILVPSGATLALDAVRAAAESEIESVNLITRKPPPGLAGAPYLVENGIDPTAIMEPTLIYQGPVREAVRHFPANVNVAAAVSLAGIGPDRTVISIWADPTIDRNSQSVELVGAATRFSVTIQSVPSPENPRTSLMTPLSTIAALRRLVAPFSVGT